MKKVFIKTIGTCALLMTLSNLLFSAENAPSKKWKDNAELSVVSTNGNSKGTMISGKNTFNYQWTRSLLELVGGGLGTESDNKQTAEQYNASEKLTRDLVGKNYIYERFGWDKDRFAGVWNRYDLSGGFGRPILDLAKDKLTGEVGAGYVNEERDNSPRKDFGSGRAYSKYVRLLSDTANFSQDIEYLVSFKDENDYRLKTETALITSVSTNVSLKTSYVWKRVNKPTPGFSIDDTITSIALIVNY